MQNRTTRIDRQYGGIKQLVGLLVLSLVFGGAAACGSDADDNVIDFFQPREIGEWEYDGEPDIDGPERLVFGDVLEGETVRQNIEISNVGRAMLELGEWSSHPQFHLSFPLYDGSPPEKLRPDESIEATLTYTARNTDAVQGQLTIESNDPDEPIYAVDLWANADFPCLELRPAERVQFGVSELDETSREFIRATNCASRSTTTFRVASLEGAEEFSLLDDSFAGDIELEPGESARIPIGFDPTEPGQYEGAVLIESNDEFEPEKLVELAGRGRPYECPEAVIRAYNPERGEVIADPIGQMQAVPLDNIELDAELSRDPEGQGIERYEWRLVEKPADATNVLDSTDEANNELWMQLSGTYVVELDVWSEHGVQSCEPARVTIEAISDEDIHVQLVWQTPADPDETDGAGTDLDLHFLHPNANGLWDSPPWDCFWRQRNPDWGVQGDDSDDPSLDIDDTDGAGPENTNLDNPESGLTYQVGVYYFSASSYGISYATVRIYIGGILTHEATRKPMQNREFWHVASIDWPSGDVNSIDRLYDSFP